MILVCEFCETKFERPGRHGPVPRFCSFRCRARWTRTAHAERLRTYSRERIRRLRAEGKRRDYERAYYQRPEVQERYRLRWHDLYGDQHPDVEIAPPYSGHRWLDMARAAVGSPDPEAPWADDRYDEMGVALIALLEGRDMNEALVAYRKEEYVPRYLTIRADDWRSDDESHEQWFDRVFPSEPSAEDVALALPESVRPRYHFGKNPRRFGNNRGQQQPSERRRRRDAGWKAHAA